MSKENNRSLNWKTEPFFIQRVVSPFNEVIKMKDFVRIEKKNLQELPCLYSSIDIDMSDNMQFEIN